MSEPKKGRRTQAATPAPTPKPVHMFVGMDLTFPPGTDPTEVQSILRRVLSASSIEVVHVNCGQIAASDHDPDLGRLYVRAVADEADWGGREGLRGAFEDGLDGLRSYTAVTHGLLSLPPPKILDWCQEDIA